MSDYTLTVTTFAGPPVVEPRKAQRCKLLEEAAEAFAAAQEADDHPDVGWECVVADELADTIQAALNLAAIHGITAADMSQAMARCKQRNHERGRC